MKYGGEKIKVVTDGLKKGDDIQALTFDSCGYLLIGKWSNTYGTKGDPLMSDEVPCGSEANCPACQPKITDVMDLPGWPSKCNNGDAILAIGSNGKLKSICRSEWEDNDRKVAVSDGDEIAGHLKDKLIVCDNDGPLSFTENEQGNFHTYCLGWDPSKAKMKFIDLTDTPNYYQGPALIYCDGDSIEYLEPSTCEDSDYAYVVYNKNTGSFDTICDNDTSYALWYFDGGSVEVPVNTEGIRIYATNTNDQSAGDLVFNGRGHLSCTDDIVTGTGTTLFSITKPGIYTITCNSTLRNETEAGLQAARGGLLIVQGGNEVEWTDFKYDSRGYTEYVNDFYPNNPDSDYIHTGSVGIDERNLELSIMSFNTTHTIVASNVSAANPMGVGFRVRCSTHLHDHRMYPGDSTSSPLNSIRLALTGGETTIGPKTRITCIRSGNIPPTYKSRF